jgi:hypothetical protein
MALDMHQTHEWITIPVPKRVAPAVYALIAQEMGMGSTTADVTDNPPHENITWTDAEIDGPSTSRRQG